MAGYSPYTQLGTSAASAYADLMGLGGQGSSAFNAAQYLAANPDVSAEYQANVDKTLFPTEASYAQWHYNNYGQSEGRNPNSEVGIGADAAQQAAISALEKSPLFTSLLRQGDEATLANASATGGLRGGNNISDLANFRSDLLAGTIQNQLAGYQGAIGTGLSAQGALTNTNLATATGSNAAQQSATDVLLQKYLGKAGINMQNWKNAGSFLDDTVSLKGVGNFAKSLF